MQAKTLLQFLENRKWQLEQTTEKFYIVKPPASLQFEEQFRVRVPVYEDSVEYMIYMKMLAQGLAKIYQMPEQSLIDFLSQPLP